MNLSRFAFLTLSMLTLAGANAYAFSLDDSTSGSTSAQARLGDPDDSIPYPHVADDGQMQTPGVVRFDAGQPAGFTSSGPSTRSSDGFNRAVENMGN